MHTVILGGRNQERHRPYPSWKAFTHGPSNSHPPAQGAQKGPVCE